MAEKVTVEFDAYAFGCLGGTLENELRQMRLQAAFARKRGEEAHTQKMLDECVGQLESCLASVDKVRRQFFGDRA